MKRSTPRSANTRGIGATTLLLLSLAVLLAVAVALWFFTTRTSKTPWTQFTGAHPLKGDPTKPKPSAARLAQPGAKATPAPQPSPATTLPPPAPAAPLSSAPAATPGRHLFANRKGFNNGCKHGELLFTTAEITFTCPSDPGKGVIIRPDNIRNVDDDGFELTPKGKYHFDIEGMSKQDAHTLFQQWLTAATATHP